MANSDKADAASQKEIEALKAEFGTELNNLGVRVDNLEKNASNVKFTGEIRSRYEYSDDSTTSKKNYEKTRVRITMTAPIAENVTFKGRLHSESSWGNAGLSSSDTNNTVLDQAYIIGKVFDGGLTYKLGRQPGYLGQGLLYDNSQNNDGLVVTVGKDVQVTAGAFKYSTWNFTAGNVDFKLNDKLHVTASYLADDADGATTAGNLYDSTAAGLKYTGLKNFTVSGEYAQNDSDWANSKNTGDAAKAWTGKIKYRGAQGSTAKSYGLWVGYRSADEGFDYKNVGTLDMANGMDTSLRENDNVKGLEYGFEYAVFKNGIMTIQYNDLEAKEGNIDKKNLIAQLVYTF